MEATEIKAHYLITNPIIEPDTHSLSSCINDAALMLWAGFIIIVFSIGVANYLDCSPNLASWTYCRKANGSNHTDRGDSSSNAGFADVLDPIMNSAVTK